MENKKQLFIWGLITGIPLMASILGVGFLSYKLGNRIIDFAGSKTQEKEKNIIPPDFRLSFESDNDSKIFDTTLAAAKISDKFATEGKHSLLVEFPAGVEYPGLLFEVYGKDCLDWEKAKAFSFDVFNSINAPASLTVKIKSGKKYPKREFEKEFKLPPLQTVRIIINRDEIENKLDLKEISYLNFLMHDPTTTFRLYFDNMKVVKNDEKLS